MHNSENVLKKVTFKFFLSEIAPRNGPVTATAKPETPMAQPQ